MKNKIYLLLLPVIFAFSGYAQNKSSTWFELEFSKKIVKNVKIEFKPELRLSGGFKMDSYILAGGLSYKLHKHLTLSGYYQYENEPNYREKREIYEWEGSNRFALDAKTEIEVQRVELQFRIRYTNGAGTEQLNPDRASYFRYRAKTEYDIRGCKLAPFGSVEAFHDLILQQVDKMRYTGGLAYPFNKRNELSMFYRLQDYTRVKESFNILGIGYSLKF